MQYKTFVLNENGVDNPYVSLDDYIGRNNCEHMQNARQSGVKILGIAESYNESANGADDRVLTDKGYLFIKMSETEYHVYSLFDEPSNLNFGHVVIINEPIDTKNVAYENTHRLVFNLKSYQEGNKTKYYYTTDGIKYGNDGTNNIYRIDIDGYIHDRQTVYPMADGFFHVSHEATNIRYLLLSYKQYMYMHLEPGDPSEDINNIEIKLVNISGEEISSKLYNFDADNYYVDIESDPNGETSSDPDEGLDISAKTSYDMDNNYMYFTFVGKNENAPTQFLLEVY